MSLKAKIEAIIYASEEPVTLLQLVGLLAEEAEAELDELASRQAQLPLSASDFEGAARGTLSADSQWHEASLPLESATEEPQIEQDEDTISNISAESTVADPAAEAEASSHDVPNELEPLQTPQPRFITPSTSDSDAEKRRAREQERAVRDHLRRTVDDLVRDYAESDRGIEVREVAGGFRMGTKPEYHDAVRGFVRLLKPALKLTLQALETLAVVAYKQPVTAAEISEIRGVDSAGVLGGLIARKLLATAGRKQVIGRPMLYKTTREFLVRFGLKDLHELPSMEEFERMAGELNEQEDLPMDSTEAVIERANVRGDADHIREQTNDIGAETELEPDLAASPQAEPGQQEHSTSGSTHQSLESEKTEEAKT